MVSVAGQGNTRAATAEHVRHAHRQGPPRSFGERQAKSSLRVCILRWSKPSVAKTTVEGTG